MGHRQAELRGPHPVMLSWRLPSKRCACKTPVTVPSLVSSLLDLGIAICVLRQLTLLVYKHVRNHLLRSARPDGDVQVRLAELLQRRVSNGGGSSMLDSVQDWASILSLGEQQRLAFARSVISCRVCGGTMQVPYCKAHAWRVQAREGKGSCPRAGCCCRSLACCSWTSPHLPWTRATRRPCMLHLAHPASLMSALVTAHPW